jgi:hypothetical protein
MARCIEPIQMFPHHDQPTRQLGGWRGLAHRLLPLPPHVFLPLWGEVRSLAPRLRGVGARRRYRRQRDVRHRYGFPHVERAEFGRSRRADRAIDRARRATESLYVEAVKAGPGAASGG